MTDTARARARGGEKAEHARNHQRPVHARQDRGQPSQQGLRGFRSWQSHLRPPVSATATERQHGGLNTPADERTQRTHARATEEKSKRANRNVWHFRLPCIALLSITQCRLLLGMSLSCVLCSGLLRKKTRRPRKTIQAVRAAEPVRASARTNGALLLLVVLPLALRVHRALDWRDGLQRQQKTHTTRQNHTRKSDSK